MLFNFQIRINLKMKFIEDAMLVRYMRHVGLKK